MTKTKRTAKKKASRKATSRFYVIKTVTGATEKLTNKLDDYNKKYIKDPVVNARDFAKDLKNEPRKTVDTIVEDGKEFVGDLKKDARKRIDNLTDDSKTFLKKAKKTPRKAINGLVDDGKDYFSDIKENAWDKIEAAFDDTRSFLQGVEKDARLIIEDVVENGKKAIEKVPGKQTFEKEFDSRIKTIPSLLNIPSKNDIEKLSRGMKDLRKKVDVLNSKYAA